MSALSAALSTLLATMAEKEHQLKKADSPTTASPVEQTTGTAVAPSLKAKGEASLSEFMARAGQPVTWIETREIWNEMRKTNNGKLPRFQDTMDHLRFGKPYKEQGSGLADHTNHDAVSLEGVLPGSKNEDLEEVSSTEENALSVIDTAIDNDTHLLSSCGELSTEDMIRIAKGIKDAYSIRHSDDQSELKFMIGALTMLWVVVTSLAIAGHYYPDNASIGRLTWPVAVEAFALFLLELVWECFLSWIVLRYDIKINYTRKLGNLMKVPKYFAADFLPFYDSTGVSMTTSLAINQTLFCIMYYRKNREKIPFFSYVFLSQDRREDRPDTLIFQVTEDIMRFAVYFPFKLLVANRLGYPAIVFIPITVNNIGDGLAEPVGVTWGRHKYSTTALYYKGKFWNGSFTRSLEGSFCVYITTVIIVAANYVNFKTKGFCITISLLPILMTIGEAKAPHTNDGPFLALIGCGFLSFIFLVVDK